MAKTEVILTHNIVGLGGESDQVKVAAGYARNYLFPQGFAIPLTGSNKRRIEALKQRRAERESHELNTMTDLAKGIMDYRDLPGFPLRTQVDLGDGEVISTLVALKIDAISDDEFVPPKDYTEMKLPNIQISGEHPEATAPAKRP